ncbi:MULTISPECIES: hypothetical protein [Bacillaceae]|uniref:Uncharacterized protein n=2 Tax=Bacillaceae TaxID=186817 RepID=A0A0V8JGW1_9BACI|nr:MULTISPECIES: hypothetical protein [Bacillaceae]KSU86299.1 hypothetical protein AS180_19385 [Priestia veravalensis]MCG7315558.1 hypothetical protein [Priestia flexa]MCP1189835.1 hypothetical protein [Priestia flexa]MCV9887125.1 hypothetical protein [Metabacillus halosaccharovorans]MEC0668311.1 hypothetical protein [Priestia flexa]
MIKNLPLLLAVFLVGLGLRSITATASLSPMLYWPVVIISTVLLIWSMVALILNIGIQKHEKIRAKMDQ